MSIFSYLLLLGQLVFWGRDHVSVSKGPGATSCPVFLEIHVFPGELSAMPHEPLGPQGHSKRKAG